MVNEEKNHYISEDIADFIIDSRTNPNVTELFPDITIHKINDTYSIIHLPVSQFTRRAQKGGRVLILPTLLGLASEVSLEASGVEKLRGIPSFNLRGNGVLIGIIDTGILYTLPEFKKKDGTTKIVSIWDQTIEQGAVSNPNIQFGMEYTREQINQALSSNNPLSVVPSTDENGHGTMLAAVAAGTENVSAGFYGVAPDAELVIVKLTQAKKYLRDFYSIPEGVVCYQEDKVMFGAEYCFEVARKLNRPLAICIGIGTSQSAHDGASPISQLLSRIADTSQIGVVIGAGNEGNLGRHFHGIIDSTVGNTTFELNVGEKDKGFSMQIWGSAPGIYSIDILSPSGEYVPKISTGLNESRRITFIFEPTIINLEIQTIESLTGDELILLNFHNASAGTWKFTVYVQGNLAGNFHAWLPMGDFISRETYFNQADNNTTIISPGNAAIPITVTAYNPVGDILYTNASRGFTRTMGIKPDLAAPGVNYQAPALNGTYTNFTGTGVASAHTTGIVGLFLEWGIVNGNQDTLDTNEIKKYLIRGAKRSSALTYPNPDWGFGILDVYNTFDVLRTNL